MTTKTTRMELIRLKKRIAFARRGHKILKDKRDSMMKQFMALVKKAKTAQANAESLYGECRGVLLESAAYSPYAELLEASVGEGERLSVGVKYAHAASIRVPSFSLTSFGYEPQFGEIAPKDAAKLFRKYSDLVLATLELATFEKGIRLMAKEIETTNRRVNALEYILIPRFEADAKSIEFKLDERERETFSTLSRISE